MAKFNSKTGSEDKGRSGRSRDDRPGRRGSSSKSEDEKKKDGYKSKRSFSKNKVFREIKETRDEKPRRTFGSDSRRPFKKDFDKKSDRSSDRPARKEEGDEKKTFREKRGSDSFERPKRSFSDRDDKKPFKKSFDRDDKPERKPFKEDRDGDRKEDSERPRRNFNDDDTVEKRKPFREDIERRSTAASERPQRSADEKDGGEKRKPFREDRDRRSSAESDRPRRSSEDSRSSENERPFRADRGGRDRDSEKTARSSEGNDSRRSSRGSEDARPLKKAYNKEDKFAGFKKATSGSGAREGRAGVDKKRRVTKPRRNEEGEESKRVKYDDFEEGRAFSKKESTEYKPTKKPVKSENNDGLIRLNKYLSNAGIASRRDADNLIQSGVVKVNGVVIDQLGYKIKQGDKVTYGDAAVRAERKVYLLLNKPKDYITTVEDPKERKTVMELISGACRERIYPVGRLDRNTTGLLLFTNDGELTTKLTHPKFGVKKVYHVSLNKGLKPDDFTSIIEGVELEDGMVKADDLAFVGEGKKEVGIEIHSGRNRVVRRIFEQLGYDVLKLDRVVFAGLTKKDLPRGKHRFLTAKEISFLQMIG